jgi:DNA transposition AAA+ family ATPase
MTTSKTTPTPAGPSTPTPRHFLDLDGARIVRTLSFAKTQRAVADVVEARAIGVIHGEAGLGKSFATAWSIRQQPLPAFAFDFPTRTSMKRITEVILRAITSVPHHGERYELSDVLLDQLAREPRLLVIDEAQRLGHEAIEYLRWLHDDPNSQFALLFVGGNGCWELLRRYPMLRRRIYRRVEFRPLKLADLKTIIPRYHAIYAEAAETTIALIDRRFARGNFGHWARFTKTAAELCRKSKKPTVTERIAASRHRADRGRTVTKPKLHVVVDPDDTLDNQQLLHALRSLDLGRVVCELRPDGGNLDWLSGDLLRSLGKRSDLAGHGRNATRLWRRTKAWMTGEQISDLFISRTYLGTPRQWKYLLDLQRDCGCDLWLIVQRKRSSRYLTGTLEGSDYEELDFDAFRRRWSRRKKPHLPHSRELVTPTTREELPLGLASLRVPLVEFPRFRASCRDLLSSDRFAAVDETYRAAAITTSSWLGANEPTEASATVFVRQLIEDSPTLDDVLIRLRAAQTAFFLDWWLLKVDPEALAAARDEEALSPLTPEAARLLRHYSSTTHAALALLVLAGKPPLASLAQATLANANSNGTTITLPDHRAIELPDYARGILASHLAYRRLQGAGPDDPLFASRQNGSGGTILNHFKPNGLRQQLNQVAADTGLTLTVRGAAWVGRDESSWRRRHGISLQPIAQRN